MRKKGQVTIFVILGIIIAFVLVLLFLNGGINFGSISKGPIIQVQDCIKESVEDSLDELMIHGGEFNPEFSYRYEGVNVSYLCYTDEYLKPCIVQKPLLVSSISDELKNRIQPDVENCLNNAKKSLESHGYEVDFKDFETSIEMIPGKIIVEVNSDLTATKEGQKSYKSIKSEVNSKIYDLAMLGVSIMNWETFYGEADPLTFMIYYPSIKVQRIKRDGGTTVYKLNDRESKEDFRFAIRSYVVPVGITG